MCLTRLQDKYHLPADVSAEHAGMVDVIEQGDESLVLPRIEAHMQAAQARLLP